MPNELFPRDPNFGRRFTDRRSVRLTLLTLLLLLTLIIGFGTYASAQLRAPRTAEPDQVRVITIPRGSTARSISALLEREEIIGHERIFLYYLLIKRATGKIQAGDYELSGNLTIPEIVEKMTQGEVVTNEVRVRVGEGWTLKQIAVEAERAGIAKASEVTKLIGSTPSEKSLPADRSLFEHYDFLKNLPAGATLEGYLFPDTYNVSREGGADEFVGKMLRNFERQFSSDLRAKAAGQNRTVRQVLIIASLIEGEVGRNIIGRALTEAEKKEIDDERKTVSDVFWTRLGLGMGLESDATIGYLTGKSRAQALLEDLKINSPYNTYRFAGLPPGPIGNPSLASIEAALNPADTPYLFFLSAPDGKAYFARTLAEHNENRRKYLD